MPKAHLIQHRNNSSDTAVLFVHGYGGDPKKTWGFFPSFVAAEESLGDWDIYSLGYATGLWFDLVAIWKADPDIRTLSLLLNTAVQTTPLDRYKSLAIVAHSMGGLIVQLAVLEYPALRSRVGHLFFFGTPSNGLAKAAFFKFWKRQIDDMAVGGTFVTSLRALWAAAFGKTLPFKLWVIAGDQDEFVPRASSIDPFPVAYQAVVPGDHLSIVKPQNRRSPSLRFVVKALVGDAVPQGPGSAARVAVEAREFQKAISLLEPHKHNLDQQGLVQLALAFEGVGRQQDAIDVLTDVRPEYTDAVGVLAGRLKRRWLVERQAADAERAEELYEDGFRRSEAANNDAQAYYHGINVAFMKLAYPNNLRAARAMARKVLGHCEKAPEHFWKSATQGEAYLLLGEQSLAIESYRKAVAGPPVPTPRELDSMYQQSVRVASLLNMKGVADQLLVVFRGSASK